VIVAPAVGADLDVITVPWWLAIELILFTNVAHSVADTVELALTVATLPCPYPLPLTAVPHVAFKFAPDVVLTKPL
jgi:hypothetical protein